MIPGWFSNYRNRLLSRADFRRKAEKNYIGQWFARRHAARLFRMAGGFIHSQVLAACVELQLFESLQNGPKKLEYLAKECSLSPDRLRHLLDAATALDLLESRSRQRYALGPLGASMLENPGVVAFVRHHSLLYRDLVDPVAIYREDFVTELSGLWFYASRDGVAEEADVRNYSELMQASQRMVADQVLNAFSFEKCRSLVDIGGGSGEFARAVLERWEHLAITVVDLPPVAEIARERLAEVNLQRRIDVVGLDAASADIPGSYDVASLIRIVHDHDDEKALAILRSARQALCPDGELLLAEPMAGKTRSGALNAAYFQVYLLAMGSGRPRTYRELKRLLKTAGFSKVRRHRTSVPLIASVLSARG